MSRLFWNTNYDKQHTAVTASAFTCGMWGLESFLLHRVVREEANEKLIATGCDRWRLLGATEATQTWSFSIFSIVQLNVVIGAFQVGLDINLIEGLWQHVFYEQKWMRLGMFKSKYNNKLPPV